MSQQRGLTWFVATFLAGYLVYQAVSNRLSDEEVTRFVDNELNQLRATNSTSDLKELSFGSARIYYSRGWVPEIGLNLANVSWKPADSKCSPDSFGVEADLISVPIRFMALLRGVVRDLNIRAADMRLDVDAIKGCLGSDNHPDGAHDQSHSQGHSMGRSKGQLVGSQPSKSRFKLADTEAAPLFSKGQWDDLLRALHAVEVDRLRVEFEGRQKQIVLNQLKIERAAGLFEVQTRLEVPPQTVFGEKLPSFEFKAHLGSDEMKGGLEAQFAEGRMSAVARIHPRRLKNREIALFSDIQVAIRDLPLSELSPILRRSGLISEPLNTRSVWLSCSGHIQGLFQTMISTEPIQLSDCQVYGKLGQIEFESGQRTPGGDIQVDQFEFRDLNLGALSKVLPEKDRPRFLNYLIDPGILAGSGKMDQSGLTELSLQLLDVRLNPRSGPPTLASTLVFPSIQLEVKRKSGDTDSFDLNFSQLNFEQGTLGPEVRGTLRAKNSSWSTADLHLELGSLRLRKRNAIELFGVSFEEARSVVADLSFENGTLKDSALSAEAINISLDHVFSSGLLTVEVKRRMNGRSDRADQWAWTVKLKSPEARLFTDTVLGAILLPPLMAQVQTNLDPLVVQSVSSAAVFTDDKIIFEEASGTIIESANSNESGKQKSQFLGLSGTLDKKSSSFLGQLQIVPMKKARAMNWQVEGTGLSMTAEARKDRPGDRFRFLPVNSELKRSLQSRQKQLGADPSTQGYTAEQLKQIETDEFRSKLGLVRISVSR